MRKHIHFKRILVSRSYLVGFVAFTCLLMCSYMQAVTRSAGTEAAFIDAYTSSATSNDVISLTNNIVLSSEQFLEKSITINGNGYSVSVPNPGLDDMGRFNESASEFRVFTIGDSVIVSMNNLTIKGGNITFEYGGAINILSTAELHLNNCIISNSRNSFSGGGGINNAGVVYLNNSMIHRNAATYGGGFLNSGVMYVENSTLSENRSTDSNGGGGACENQGMLYINNSTLSNNQSTEIGGGINNIVGTLYILNSSVTGNVAYGASNFTGGGIGNNRGTVYAVNTLFAHNYHILSGTVDNPGSFELDDVKAYLTYQNQVYIYYCIYHAALPVGTNNVIGNKQYTGLQNGSNNTIFSGGSLSKITDGTGTEIGTATLYRPFLYNNSGSVAPTVKIGSYLLQSENKGSQTRFSNNNNVNPSVAYYDKTSQTWVDLLNTSTSGQLITSDQISAARANPPVVGAIETATTEILYMVKVNSNQNGTVNGGTFFGDVYAAGTSVNLTAIPNSGYHFVRWDYVGGVGGIGTASAANPYTFTVNNDITLVPVFAVNGSSYYITYIGNDNTSGDAPATDSYNAPTTILPTGTLERTGYTIEGWNTNANGSGTDYAVGATYSDGVNLTLYAKWTKNIAILQMQQQI